MTLFEPFVNMDMKSNLKISFCYILYFVCYDVFMYNLLYISTHVTCYCLLFTIKAQKMHSRFRTMQNIIITVYFVTQTHKSAIDTKARSCL